MDYKKIIKSRAVRLKILHMLSFIPDKTMVKIQYRIKTGHRLNLKDPKRFTEKLQWYKLYYHDPIMVKCVDKYDVREYVESIGLGSILIPCYGVYETANEIQWDKLPNEFVMKDTLGGGGTSVRIVTDKSSEDLNSLSALATMWVSRETGKKGAGREWPYYSGKNHRIIIEKLLKHAQSQNSLVEYKFFCFNGKCEFLYVMGDRNIGESVKVSLYDRDYNLLSVTRSGDERYDQTVKPNNFKELLYTAEKLSNRFPHVRVDLYDIDENIQFGELTFYNASGYMKYEPDRFDYEIGDKFVLKQYS